MLCLKNSSLSGFTLPLAGKTKFFIVHVENWSGEKDFKFKYWLMRRTVNKSYPKNTGWEFCMDLDSSKLHQLRKQGFLSDTESFIVESDEDFLVDVKKTYTKKTYACGYVAHDLISTEKVAS